MVPFVILFVIIVFCRESLWKWDYVLKVNGSVIRPDAVQTIDTGHLTELTNTSLKIQLKTWTAFYINHEKHFSLYVANKIADIDLSIVKDKIHKAWLNMGECKLSLYETEMIMVYFYASLYVHVNDMIVHI